MKGYIVKLVRMVATDEGWEGDPRPEWGER